MQRFLRSLPEKPSVMSLTDLKSNSGARSSLARITRSIFCLCARLVGSGRMRRGMRKCLPVLCVGKIDQETARHATKHCVVKVKGPVGGGHDDHTLVLLSFEAVPHAHKFILDFSHCLMLARLLPAPQYAREIETEHTVRNVLGAARIIDLRGSPVPVNLVNKHHAR